MSTATAPQTPLQTIVADAREPALPLRGDTFLGVCEAVGQDLGINPNWLRIPFAAALLWNPELIVASYLGLGIVVALARLLFPARARASTAKTAETAVRAGAAGEKVEVGCEERLAA